MRYVLKALGNLWRKIAEVSEWFAKTYIHNVNPRDALATYVLTNLIVSIVCLFLYCKWVDRYTVAGYFIGLTGLMLAMLELYRTRMFSVEIQQEVERAVFSLKQQHFAELFRRSLESAKFYWVQVQSFLEGGEWKSASLFMRQLANQLVTVDAHAQGINEPWHQFSDHLLRFQTKTREVKSQADYKIFRDDLNQLMKAIFQHLEDELAGFRQSA